MLTSLTFKSKMHISEMITSLGSASPMYKSVTYIHQFLRQGKYFDKATRKQVIYQLLWVINNLCVGKIIALTDLLTRCWNGILSAWQYSSRRIFSQAWMTKNIVYWYTLTLTDQKKKKKDWANLKFNMACRFLKFDSPSPFPFPQPL